MIILITRSEVKVTVAKKWYVTLRHPKKHSHTNAGVLISNNIGDSMPILLTRPDFKVTVTHGWCMTLHYPKMHAHTKFGIPTSNDIRDMLWTQSF